MKLCSHVVTHDSGLAPNPFHDFCTSAVCTPSHMKAKRLVKGVDWLVGNSPVEDGNRLVYAMLVSEVLTMNEYFGDRRFQAKKPKPYGAPKEQCGDNIYYQDEDLTWKRSPSFFHNDYGSFMKDVGCDFAGRPVFVSEHFYYFGRDCVIIPEEFETVIQDRQGVHYTHDPVASHFVNWLERKYEPGIRGTPRDMADHAGETGVMITDLTFDGAQTNSQKRGDCGSQSRFIMETAHRVRGCG